METQYICRLGEFTGSCHLELRVGTDTAVPKFSRADSLYILDDAFYQVLEPLFRLVVQDFDMFGGNCKVLLAKICGSAGSTEY